MTSFSVSHHQVKRSGQQAQSSAPTVPTEIPGIITKDVKEDEIASAAVFRAATLGDILCCR
jgi:hypothetical protein